MTIFEPPIDEMRFVLENIAGLHQLEQALSLETASADLTATVLSEAGKFAAGKLAPLNQPGDLEGAVLENGVVRTASGFKEAYRAFAADGWNGAVIDSDHGGQGLPWATQMALTELWNAANMSFALCPLLNQAAIDALIKWGTDAQKDAYIEKLVTGEWTAAMCLTEPQAGTDVGALRTRAQPEGDHFRITGTKIYISYGEHDFTDNIIHLVLARLPDAPTGTKGISLFIVPKFIPDETGEPGQRNDMRCVSLEHKLGIRASPTCVMSYGDDGGAIGYLVGQPNGGMKAMFTMMNNARIAVGVQGLGIAERAFQQAKAYAAERVQGRIDGKPAAIIQHPDIQRRLMSIRTLIAAMRALCYWAGAQLDIEARSTDADERADAGARVAVLTPIVKAWCSDRAVEITSTTLQIHGGMGFMEETGAAQHYRDARILPIYEGTNAVQAIDLAVRKLTASDGTLPGHVIAELRHDAGVRAFPALVEALDILETATATMQDRIRKDGPLGAQSAASAYLDMFGSVVAGCLLARGAAFSDDWASMTRFHCIHHLPPALSLRSVIEDRAA
jgi:alkylation response protein AidB-like acyl-CoA dehydrogenase